MAALTSPWTYLIVVVVFLAGFTSGIKVESDHRDAQEKTAIVAMHNAYVEGVHKSRAVADAISVQLNNEQTGRQNDKTEFDRKLREAKNANVLGKCEAQNPQPNAAGGSTVPNAPVIYVNAGLWDTALKIGSAPGSNPGRVDAPASGAITFVTLEEAYANLGDNSERWAACRSQVRNWQDLARKNGWVTSP